MIKRILLTTLIVLLSGGMLGCYFYFVGQLSAQGRKQARCQRVDVILLDSLETAIVDRQEVKDLLVKSTRNRITDSIDLYAIEQLVASRGEVMSAEVYTADSRTLAVRITQRKPVVRLDKGRERWYADPEGYLFPVRNAVDVPVVTGAIPFTLDAAYKGPTPRENRDWMQGMVELARYIDSKPVLRSEVAQIDIAPDGDIVLYTRTAGPAIIFGDSGDYANKFRKLEAWWRNIEPQVEEGKTYKTINLKYNQQIICKQL